MCKCCFLAVWIALLLPLPSFAQYDTLTLSPDIGTVLDVYEKFRYKILPANKDFHSLVFLRRDTAASDSVSLIVNGVERSRISAEVFTLLREYLSGYDSLVLLMHGESLKDVQERYSPLMDAGLIPEDLRCEPYIVTIRTGSMNRWKQQQHLGMLLFASPEIVVICPKDARNMNTISVIPVDSIRVISVPGNATGFGAAIGAVAWISYGFYYLGKNNTDIMDESEDSYMPLLAAICVAGAVTLVLASVGALIGSAVTISRIKQTNKYDYLLNILPVLKKKMLFGYDLPPALASRIAP